MNYTTVTQPKWDDAGQTRLSCIVSFTGLGELPFTASADDPELHGQEIFARVSAGEFGTVAEYVEPDVAPVPVPASISDRQFFQQLAVEGKITEAEAIAAVKTGELPLILTAFVDALPEDQRFSATMLLSGATEFLRSHPMTDILGASQNMDGDAIDQFFRNGANL